MARADKVRQAAALLPMENGLCRGRRTEQGEVFVEGVCCKRGGRLPGHPAAPTEVRRRRGDKREVAGTVIVRSGASLGQGILRGDCPLIETGKTCELDCQ